MKKVTRPDRTFTRLLLTGDQVWDQALCHFTTNFPRLMAHIAKVGVGDRTTLFAPPFPSDEPFAVLTLRQGHKTKFEAIEDLATTLVLLARYLRYHARNEKVADQPVLPPPTDEWGAPTVH